MNNKYGTKMGHIRLDSSRKGRGKLVGCFEDSNEYSGSIKSGEFFGLAGEPLTLEGGPCWMQLVFTVELILIKHCLKY